MLNKLLSNSPIPLVIPKVSFRVSTSVIDIFNLSCRLSFSCFSARRALSLYDALCFAAAAAFSSSSGVAISKGIPI